MMIASFLLFAVFICFSSFSCGAPVSLPLPLNRLVFGSCNNHNRPQPLWPAIAAEESPVFLWLGDIGYFDHGFLGAWRWDSTKEEIAQGFHKQFHQGDYKEIRQNMKILGISDDHDNGRNDCDINNPLKEYSSQALLDFLEEPAESPRRKRQGLYESYLLGDSQDHLVKLILLDVRFHQNFTDGNLLGEAQWRWLAEEIQRIPEEKAKFLLIGSSIQILPTQRWIGEGWRLFMKERTRLLSLLAAAELEIPVLFLSGDVHYGEFLGSAACRPLTGGQEGFSVQPLVEFTSSGLTHSVGLQTFGLVDPLIEWILGNSQQILSEKPRCLGLNYGAISWDWENRKVKLENKGKDGKICSELELDFQALERRTIMAPSSRMLPENAKAAPAHFPMSDEEALNACAFEIRRARPTERVINVTGTGLAKTIICGAFGGLLFVIFLLISYCRKKIRGSRGKEKAEKSE